jgi:hypothetical protein
MSRMDDKLDALWAEYRQAVPDPEPGADFTPGLWKKIEARRSERTTSVFRRFAQICVAASVALALLLSVVSTTATPAAEAFYAGTYVDILAEHATDYSQVLPVGDLE